MEHASILQLKNLTKRFGSNTALDEVNFDLRPGEVHALVGENGAGKSTMMRILAGIYQEFEGQYLKEGAEIAPASPGEALKFGIGMIHQELSVIPELSVAENLHLGRLPKTGFGAIDWKRLNKEAEAQLEAVNFEHIRVQAALETYPLGFQQVVEILRTVNSGAQILIMDEPTSALSPKEIDVLMGLIENLNAEGRSIVYIFHFIDEVLRVADRITVLRDSRHVATLERKHTDADGLISLILGRAADTKLPKPAERQKGEVLLEAKALTSDSFKDIDLSIGAGEIVGLFGAIGAGHFDLGRSFSSVDAVRLGLAYATESRRQGRFPTAS